MSGSSLRAWWHERGGPLLLVAGSFFLFAAVRAPVPGPNEPHYLTKARHFWNPDWCAGDFFLESADTHRVFYAVLGPPAANVPFPVAAWLGRLLAHLLLAWGWTELLARVLPGRWSPLWAAWLYLGLAAVGNLSGEWVVGGVEAKVFGYAFAFLGVAWLTDRSWLAAAAALGLAVAWHPVVGGWACVSIAIGGGGLTVVGLLRSPKPEADAAPLWPSPGIGLAAIALLVVCAAPGLSAAFELFGTRDTRPAGKPWVNEEANLSVSADYIQVQHRLAHHLDPMKFGTGQPIPDDDHRVRLWSSYAALFLGWLLLRRWLPRRRAEREFAAFVVGTVVVAMIGLAIGFRTVPWLELPYESIAWRVGLLKYYWFRLADIVVPTAFAAAVAGFVANYRWAGTRVAWGGFGLAFLLTLGSPNANGVNSDLTSREQREWREMCAWIRENTPPDARFRTPHSGIAFKWYAQRPQFLAGKDCPQDAAGIVEWNERSNWFGTWAAEQYADERYSEYEIREVSRAMEIDYFVCWHLGPVEMEPLHQVGDFRIYDVRE